MNKKLTTFLKALVKVSQSFSKKPPEVKMHPVDMVIDLVSPPRKDTYRSFRQLSYYHKDGQSYTRTYARRRSKIAIVTPHGGGIERGTSEIVDGIAGDKLTFYKLEGILSSKNNQLHVTSTNFRETVCMQIIRSVESVVTIHACDSKTEKVFVGGLDAELKRKIIHELKGCGFEAVDDDTYHSGTSRDNICNMGRSGKGVQIEISNGLRNKMFASLSRAGRKQTTDTYDRFVGAMRRAVLS